MTGRSGLEPAVGEGPLVPCPGCHKRSRFGPANPWRPFCSETCRTLDLGAWASERYRVQATPPADDGDDADPGARI